MLMSIYHECANINEPVVRGNIERQDEMPADRYPRRERREYEHYEREETHESRGELINTRLRLYKIITELTRDYIKLEEENTQLKKESEESKVKMDQEKSMEVEKT